MIRSYLDLFARMSRKEDRVILTSGNKVIYPSQGPCLIGPVIKKVIDGRPVSFYQLALLDDSGGELFVPVDKVQNIGIRPMLNMSDIPKVLGQLKGPSGADKGWKQRADDNLKLLTSGSAFDLAEIVKSLTQLSEKRMLSFRESQTLEKARKLLIGEISEVMGETKSAAEEQINNALKGEATAPGLAAIQIEA
jgi:CarD family transcriptional regulator, regulator of rRNA transcription